MPASVVLLINTSLLFIPCPENTILCFDVFRRFDVILLMSKLLLKATGGIFKQVIKSDTIHSVSLSVLFRLSLVNNRRAELLRLTILLRLGFKV